MYLWLDLSILCLYMILIFILELFRQCWIFSFSFHLHNMVCIVQHGMYCPAWYVFSSMVCIFQNGMYFPALYFLAGYVLSSMVCIVQHGMYFSAWYAFSNMVCIVHFIQYVICLLVWEAIIAICFSNAKFKVSLMVNNKIIGISCEDLMKYPVSRGKWLVIAC